MSKTNPTKLDSAPTRALLVGVTHHGQTTEATAESLEELYQLVTTLGLVTVQRISCRREHVDSRTYIGKGKVEEIGALIESESLDTIVFDDDLSPTQQRNLIDIWKCDVVDRTGIILAIFADHARTREAKTQVEVAQAEYQLTRLVGKWTHLGRQAGGGLYTKGMGEKQIEADRRLLKRKIRDLKKELEKVQSARDVQSSRRHGTCYCVALVGYTNSGKSTLQNALCGSETLVADRLFATLDPTTRILTGPDQSVLVSDTVGFIHKLPHHLVASFRSTLTELHLADLVLHVVDVSNPAVEKHLDAVIGVMQQQQRPGQRIVTVFNKADLVTDEAFLDRLRYEHAPSIAVSALRGDGLEELRNLIGHAREAAVTTFTVDETEMEGE